ncbi:MAG: DNA translocase FtsK 4TM domain-containing protein [Anaerolineae bacterium]|nr:DNA translocase FtsK 4TM domain-containing protein [Anaerolineae bacterium]
MSIFGGGKDPEDKDKKEGEEKGGAKSSSTGAFNNRNSLFNKLSDKLDSKPSDKPEEKTGSPFKSPFGKTESKPFDKNEDKGSGSGSQGGSKSTGFFSKPSTGSSDKSPSSSNNPFQNKPATSSGGFQKPGGGSPFPQKDDKKDPGKDEKTSTSSFGKPAFGGGKPDEKTSTSSFGKPAFGGNKPDEKTSTSSFGKPAFGGGRPDEKKDDKPASSSFGKPAFGSKPDDKKDDKKESKPAGGLFGRFGGGGKGADDKKEDKKDDKKESKPAGGGLGGFRFGGGKPEEKKDDKKESKPAGGGLGGFRFGGGKPEEKKDDKKEPPKSGAFPKPSDKKDEKPSAPSSGGGILGRLSFGKKEEPKDTKGPTPTPLKTPSTKPPDKKDEGAKPGGLFGRITGRAETKDDDKKGAFKPSTTPPPKLTPSGPTSGSTASSPKPGATAPKAPPLTAFLSRFRRGGAGSAPTTAADRKALIGTNKAGAPPTRLDKPAKPLDKPLTQVAVKRQGLSLDQKLDIAGWALLITGAVIFFGTVQPGEGTITDTLVRVAGGLFGYARYIVPAVLVALGGWLLVRRFRENPFLEFDIRQLTGAVILFLTLVTTLHALELLQKEVDTWEQLDQVSNSAVDVMQGGGWVGSFLYLILIRVANEFGLWAVLGGFWIVSVMLTFEITTAEISTYTKSVVGGINRRFRGIADRRRVWVEGRVQRKQTRQQARAAQLAAKQAAAAQLQAQQPQGQQPAAIPAAATLLTAAPAPIGIKRPMTTEPIAEPVGMTSAPAPARLGGASSPAAVEAKPTPFTGLRKTGAAPAARSPMAEEEPAPLTPTARPAPAALGTRSKSVPAPDVSAEDEPVAAPAPIRATPLGSKTLSTKVVEGDTGTMQATKSLEPVPDAPPPTLGNKPGGAAKFSGTFGKVEPKPAEPETTKAEPRSFSDGETVPPPPTLPRSGLKSPFGESPKTVPEAKSDLKPETAPAPALDTKSEVKMEVPSAAPASVAAAPEPPKASPFGAKIASPFGPKAPQSSDLNKAQPPKTEAQPSKTEVKAETAAQSSPEAPRPSPFGGAKPVPTPTGSVNKIEEPPAPPKEESKPGSVPEKTTAPTPEISAEAKPDSKPATAAPEVKSPFNKPNPFGAKLGTGTFGGAPKPAPKPTAENKAVESTEGDEDGELKYETAEDTPPASSIKASTPPSGSPFKAGSPFASGSKGTPFGSPPAKPTSEPDADPRPTDPAKAETPKPAFGGAFGAKPAVPPPSPAAETKPPLSTTPKVEEKADVPTVRRTSGGWELPEFRELLEAGTQKHIQDEVLREQAKMIEDTLEAFGAPGKVIATNPGPVITQFGVEPGYLSGRGGSKTRVKVSAIAKLDADLALALAARSIRIEAPVPGKGYVGIEVPNPEAALVGLRDIMEDKVFTKINSKLRVALGRSIDGAPIITDLTGLPHMLIAGTTGSGKSVCVNAVIACLLLENSPEDLQMIMVDPKRVELTGYNGIPHLISPVVVDLERIVGVLKWVTREMDERYKKFSAMGARNITDYNNRLPVGDRKMPYLVVIIDELADLMMLAPDETERVLTRLAQMARATGIHLILSTQRPSVDVVTGLIKANFPARISFAVASGVDSRVILDQPGAEKLLGRGDMLYQAPDAPAPLRVQGVFVSDAEINRITKYWRDAAAQFKGAKASIPLSSFESSERNGGAAVGGGGGSTPRLGGFPTASRSSTPIPSGDKAFYDAIREPEPSDSEDAGDVEEHYKQAVALFNDMKKISVSLLQRRLRIGFNRARKVIDLMKQRGVLGANDPVAEEADDPS